MSKGRIIFSLIIIVLLIFGGAFAYFYTRPNQEVVPAFDYEKLNLVIGDEIINQEIYIEYNEILLPMKVIKEYFDPNIWWDDNLNKVTITTKDKLIRMRTDDLEAFVNQEPVTLNIPVTEKKGEIYIPIEFLSDLYDLNINYFEDKNVVLIDYDVEMWESAQIIYTEEKEVPIRKKPSIHSPILEKIKANNENNILRVFQTYEKWYKVRTSYGIVGYVQKKYVYTSWIYDREKKSFNSKANWKPEEGKINLVWEMMFENRPDLDKINIKGVDVISPTWFQVIDEEGGLINRSYSGFVEWSHEKNIKVWALISNDFGDPDMTKKILNNSDARDNIIRQVLAYVSLYNLDGINIDFENIYKIDKDAFTQFVREITPLLKEQGLIVSVDVTIPDGSDNWSKCYDREALGKIVDYVCVMTYDQHWSTSPKAGSVAGMEWVENNIIKMVDLVPREKLLLGCPLYTYLWEVETYGSGEKVVSSRALSMENAKQKVKDNNAKVIWDEKNGQFYTEYKKEDKKYKIWIEDVNSMNLRTALIHKYGLAGAALWKRSDAVPEIWDLMHENLKEIETYQEWVEKNNENKYVYSNT